MRAFVNYVDTDGARARKAMNVDDIRDDEMVVQYSQSPEHWKMSEWEARSWCTVLNRANVYATKWPQHHCTFEIVEVGPEEYAIVCNDHPDWR